MLGQATPFLISNVLVIDIGFSVTFFTFNGCKKKSYIGKTHQPIGQICSYVGGSWHLQKGSVIFTTHISV